ncbi:uncharacterized protein V1516DRAFT_492767 [Lipomyces oligophaga]|uniref:uncharacterized protein n=1 Tax=Lipomyces oligophaga TaxID=45792 RepID=UPI0034CD9801
MRSTNRILRQLVDSEGLVYLIRHRQGPVIVHYENEVTEKLLKSQLSPKKVPSINRLHDWSVLCVARLPDKTSETALRHYMLELRRKRERLYEENKEIKKEWLRERFPKRHALTFEAVSDLANALEYLYKQPTDLSKLTKPQVTENGTPRRFALKPEEEAVVYWSNDWFRGPAKFWSPFVIHKTMHEVRLRTDVKEVINALEKDEEASVDLLG